MKRYISSFCLICLFLACAPAQALIVKDGIEIVVVPNSITTSKKIPDYNLQATIAEDVFYKGVKIFSSGDKAILTVQDSEKAGFFGNGGSLLVANGYAYDVKGNKRKISFTRNIDGKDKTWPKVLCTTGILLWPLLLFGFVKGGEAKLLPKDVITALTMSSFEF